MSTEVIDADSRLLSELEACQVNEEVLAVNRSSEILVDALVLSLGLVIGALAFAQYDGMSASQSINKAGEAMEDAGANTPDAADHSNTGREDRIGRPTL